MTKTVWLQVLVNKIVKRFIQESSIDLTAIQNRSVKMFIMNLLFAVCLF